MSWTKFWGNRGSNPFFEQIPALTIFLPPDLRDWLPENDLAHSALEALERVEKWHFKVNARGTGDAKYHPRKVGLADLLLCQRYFLQPADRAWHPSGYRGALCRGGGQTLPSLRYLRISGKMVLRCQVCRTKIVFRVTSARGLFDPLFILRTERVIVFDISRAVTLAGSLPGTAG